MKAVALALAFLFVHLVGQAQETEGVDIIVTVDNVLNDNGKVIATLHTSDTFMKGPGIQNLESSIENGKVTLTFKNVAPGTYAIMTLHDENENRRMDFQANGMPLESYGMSGNDMSFGPPNFANAQFDVEQDNLSFNIRF